MKVLGIMGSPRKNGNTNALLNQALEGAKSLGANTSIVYVNELNIRGCQGCNTCKEVQHCILDDDMKQIYKKLDESDVIIFASPNYLGQITAQMKLVYDRMYAYSTKEGTMLLSKNKKVGLIMTQRQPDASIYSYYIKTFMYYLNIYFAGGSKSLIAAGVENIGEAAQNTEYMQDAFDLGKELIKL